MPRASYDPVLSGQALAVLSELPKARQRELIALVFRLALLPSQIGDYTTTDDTGRVLQNILLDSWHITYWADHAVKEFRIVDISEV